MADTYVTKAPTGLQVERNGNEFTFSWKIRDKDHGAKQTFQYQIMEGGAWNSVAVVPAQTSVSVQLDPSVIRSLSFRVRGQRKAFTEKVPATNKDGSKKKDKNGKIVEKTVTVKTAMSAWATKTAAWVPTRPARPTVEYTRDSANSGTFKVEFNVDNDGTGIARYVQYETAVSKNTKNPPTDFWTGHTDIDASADVSEEVSYTEQNEDITKGGVIRWFRARTIGAGGTAGWVYAHHAYSKPVVPALKNATAKRNAARASTAIYGRWTTTQSILRPIDEEIMQYVFAVPDNVACNPPSSGWTDAISVTPSGKKDIVTASVSEQIATDQCLWVRVAAKHDESYTSYSKAFRVAEAKLAKPGISATPNFTTGNVDITITINTSCAVAKHLIFYRPSKSPKSDKVIAIFAAGETSRTISVPAIIGKSRSCFGAYAFVGTNSGLKVNAIMKSDKAVDQDIAPVEPDPLTLEKAGDGSVSCGLTWKWAEADEMEISWSDNKNAWQSNVTPSSCIVPEPGVSSWNIHGLDVGKTWYFQARYKGRSDDDEITTAWCDMREIDLATDPDTPKLTLNRDFVLPGGSVGAAWDYVNTDNSPQDTCQICLANVSSSTVTYGAIIAHAGSEQNLTVNYNWVRGTTYHLACRVRAASGKYSEWSDPISIYCPQKPTAQIVYGNPSPITNGIMTRLGVIAFAPTSDNCDGEYSLSIIRAKDYHVDRPDDGIYDGYNGETIFTASGWHYNGSVAAHTHELTKDTLIGELDDGAHYKIVGTFVDAYEQKVTKTVNFKVNWSHKASIKRPKVQADKKLMAMRITPRQPTGYAAGDTFDIYRITADQPELIVKDGTYGTTYVDPYPGFGNLCGHRVVAKTATGSYITAGNGLAWYDLGERDGDIINSDAMVIDANGMQIQLPYNLQLSNKWQKDFKRTSYLGGSVQGDWNPAVLRDLTAKTVIVRNEDTGELMDLRDLAAYAGPAHIRTPDGSSFSCDIQVSEDAAYDNRTVSYSLTIKGIDPAEPDGMTLAEWRALHPVG